jgi:hypothetical protein
MLAAFALLTVLTGPAAAQSVSVYNIATRDVPDKGANNTYRYWINRADCRANDVLHFQATVSGAVLTGSRVLEVWASSGSADCTQNTNRGNASNSCWLVFQGTPSSLIYQVDVRAQNIVAQKFPSETGGGNNGTGGTDGAGGTSGSGGAATGGIGGGTASGGTGGTTSTSGSVFEADASVCEKGTSFEKALGLYFMIMEGSQMVGTHALWTQTGVDVSPPRAPTNVVAAAGENRLLVTWETETVNDLLEWRLYCDPPPGGGAVVDSGLINNTSAFGVARQAQVLDAGAGTGGAVATGGTTASGGEPATGGDTGSGGSVASGGTPGLDAGSDAGLGSGGRNPAGTGGTVTATGGSSNGSTCTSQSLFPGKDPPESHLCGRTSGDITRNGDAEGLENGTTYAVGVVGVDIRGNIGPLSPLDCEKPVLQTDFFELYRKWGGKGGGGICSISHDNALSPALGLGTMSLLSLGLLRRRKRH